MPDGFQPPAGKPAPDSLRNISAALDLQPDGIIINLPSNDAATGNNASVQMANFRAMTQLAAQQGVPVWVCTTQPRIFNANAIAIQLATRDSILAYYGPYAIDFWTGLADSSGLPLVQYDSGDGVHLNDAGHKILFERVESTNLPDSLLKPSNSPDYRIAQLITERSCADEDHLLTFVVQNLGIADSSNYLLDINLLGDSSLFFSQMKMPLSTCQSDTLHFFVDLSTGGKWSISPMYVPLIPMD